MPVTNKSKIQGLKTMHTAGIFADMTVDGPEIGTLVIIVDRAKNLPNRKTIGKQHPYCAARLGKEAKKTDTDRRGGQTPKWDQELRYTVHDSPDYYQLKVSIFNDNKKTDLIGEAWVDLKEVIIPGGSQNDLWHTLNFKGKYAGELRVEITYYDTRPQQEKSEINDPNIQKAIESEIISDGIQKGPLQKQLQKPELNSRSISSCEVIGEPSMVTNAVASSRKTSAPNSSFSQSKNTSEAVTPTSLPHEVSPSTAPKCTPEAQQKHSKTSGNPDLELPCPNDHPDAREVTEHGKTVSRDNKVVPPMIKPEHDQGHTKVALQKENQSSSKITNQSTPQAQTRASFKEEYNEPAIIPFNGTNTDNADDTINQNFYGDFSETNGAKPASLPLQKQNEKYDNLQHRARRADHRPENRGYMVQRDQYTPRNFSCNIPYEIPTIERLAVAESPEGPPPPPPIHRSRNTSPHIIRHNGPISSPVPISSPAPIPILEQLTGCPDPFPKSYGLGYGSKPIDDHRYALRKSTRIATYQSYIPEERQELNQYSGRGANKRSSSRNVAFGPREYRGSSKVNTMTIKS